MNWVHLCENLVSENVLSNNITVSHIPGKSNLSDIFTKEFRDVSHFLSLRNLSLVLSTEFSTGRLSSGAPFYPTYKDRLTTTTYAYVGTLVFMTGIALHVRRDQSHILVVIFRYIR